MGVRSGITIAFQDEDIVDVGSVALDEITSDAGTTVKVTLGDDSGDDFKVDETSLVVQGDTGNVGIGTATPRRTVDVVDASNPQLRLSRADDSDYVDLGVTSNANLLTEGDASNFYNIVRGNTAAYTIYQNNTTGDADGSGKGLEVGTTNNSAFIRSYGSGSNGTLNIGAGGSGGLTFSTSNDVTVLAGYLALESEDVAPSAPADGDGGILYVKSDGKLYFISHETAETDLTAGGSGGGYTVESKSTSFTAAIEYFYIVTGTSAAITVTLPSASAAGSSGKKIGFKFMDAADHTVTISRDGTDKIDEIAVDLEINTQSSLELISDGTHWFTV